MIETQEFSATVAPGTPIPGPPGPPGGVNSFRGRTGEVTPQPGDYSAEDITEGVFDPDRLGDVPVIANLPVHLPTPYDDEHFPQSRLFLRGDGVWVPPNIRLYDEGASVPFRSAINFAGEGVTVTDTPSQGYTSITIPGNTRGVITGGSTIAVNTTAVTSLFTGANVLGSLTLPGGTLQVGASIDISVIGYLTVPGNGTPALTFYLFGNSVQLGTSAITTSTALNGRTGILTFQGFIWRDTATTSKAVAVLRIQGDDSATQPVSQGRFTLGSPVDFSQPVTLDVRAGFAAAHAGVGIRNQITQVILRTV